MVSWWGRKWKGGGMGLFTRPYPLRGVEDLCLPNVGMMDDGRRREGRGGEVLDFGEW